MDVGVLLSRLPRHLLATQGPSRVRGAHFHRQQPQHPDETGHSVSPGGQDLPGQDLYEDLEPWHFLSVTETSKCQKKMNADRSFTRRAPTLLTFAALL